MPNQKPVQFKTEKGKIRTLTAHDGKKLTAQLIAELMEKEKRTTTEIALLGKLLKEYREALAFIDTRTKMSKIEKKLEALTQQRKG